MRQSGAERFPLAFCAYESKPVFGTAPVISRAAAATSCDDDRIAFDQDHISIVKPESTKAYIYEWARLRILEASELGRGLPSPASVQQRMENLLPGYI